MARSQIINSLARPISVLAGSGIGLMSLSCGGSVSANAKANGSADGNTQSEANFDAAGETGAWETNEHTLSEDQTNQGAQQRAPGFVAGQGGQAPLLGARHDLSLGPQSQETCRCLAVKLGAANLPDFVWSADQPTLASNQLVIALTSNNISCKGAETGASYMGYEVKDGDVIVKVEAANSGRPITGGAIIPRPAQGKLVYLQPVAGLPYGQGLSGEARCTLGSGTSPK